VPGLVLSQGLRAEAGQSKGGSWRSAAFRCFSRIIVPPHQVRPYQWSDHAGVQTRYSPAGTRSQIDEETQLQSGQLHCDKNPLLCHDLSRRASA